MDKLKTLLETASDADKVELKIHHNATVSCLKSYNDEPTAAKQRDLSSARAALDEVVSRLWGVYFPEEERLETVKEALAFLVGKGFKVKNSKFYADCKGTIKTPAKVGRQKDGSFLKRDLLLYAKTLPYLGDPAAGLDQAQRRKLDLETRKIEKQTELLEHELSVKQGKFVPREEAELARAAAISIIEANIRNLHLTNAGDWISIVEGAPAAASRLIDAMGQALDDLFNRLSKMDEFQVQP